MLAPVIGGVTTGTEITWADTPCRNPAFDLTPAALISALVTERGVVTPATGESVLDLLRRG